MITAVRLPTPACGDPFSGTAVTSAEPQPRFLPAGGFLTSRHTFRYRPGRLAHHPQPRRPRGPGRIGRERRHERHVTYSAVLAAPTGTVVYRLDRQLPQAVEHRHSTPPATGRKLPLPRQLVLSTSRLPRWTTAIATRKTRPSQHHATRPGTHHRPSVPGRSGADRGREVVSDDVASVLLTPTDETHSDNDRG